MGFGGGGGAALPNHQHTNVPLTGGPLDFSNVTIASLLAGSLTYSDGANLQELTIGGAGDKLEVLAGIPAWVPATGLGMNTITDHLATSFSTTSATYVSTGLSLTLSDETGGNANIIASGQWRNTTVDRDVHGTLTNDGTRITDSSRIGQMRDVGTGDITPQGYCSATNIDTDGSVIEFEIHSGGVGTAYLSASATYVCALIALELY